MKITIKFWLGLGILIILSPLGLLLPERLKAGAAWGEWGIEELRQLVGYVPLGLKKLSGIWNAPIPHYAFKGWEENSLPRLSFAYIISAVIGIAVIVILVLLIGKMLSKKGD